MLQHADDRSPTKGSSGVRPAKFLDLPREIRDIIYEYAVRSPHNLAVARRQPRITRVSRQVREETLAMFYEKNEFVVFLGILTWDAIVRRLKEWLKAIGVANWSHIRALVVYEEE